MLKTLIVVPTYNERENLPRLIAAIHAVVPAADIRIVDDASPDGTGSIAEEIGCRDGRVSVMHRAGKQGLGTAYVAGFRYALARDYERVVQMDADFSHRPEDLPRLLDAAATSDVVIGSRYVAGGSTQNWSWRRQAVSRGGALYTRWMLGLPLRDCTSGFKCWRRSALARLDLDRVSATGFGFQVEMNYLAHRAGLALTEVPIVFPDRAAGRSKMSARIFLEAFRLVWRLRLRAERGTAIPSRRPSAERSPR